LPVGGVGVVVVVTGCVLFVVGVALGAVVWPAAAVEMASTAAPASIVIFVFIGQLLFGGKVQEQRSAADGGAA
jgi:hypothetical protein